MRKVYLLVLFGLIGLLMPRSAVAKEEVYLPLAMNDVRMVSTQWLKSEMKSSPTTIYVYVDAKEGNISVDEGVVVKVRETESHYIVDVTFPFVKGQKLTQISAYAKASKVTCVTFYKDDGVTEDFSVCVDDPRV